MSLDKALVFSKRLTGVSLERTGPAPIGGDTLKQELEKSFKAGFEAAQEKFNAQMLEMRTQMQSHAHGVLQKIEDAHANLEKTFLSELPELIVAGVYKVIGANAMDAGILKSRIETTVAESCPTNEPVEVRVNPQDLEALREIDEKLVTGHPRFTFKADEDLGRGDCLMKTKFGVVDATLKTQLGRMREELSGV